MDLLPTQAEEAFFFSIDDKSNHGCHFRESTGLQGQISDCLIYYKHGRNRVLCIVELKGSNLGEAVQQIVNTRQALHTAMHGSRNCRSISIRAYIYRFGSSPNMNKRRDQELKDILLARFGIGNYKISSFMQIGPFVRGSG